MQSLVGNVKQIAFLKTFFFILCAITTSSNFFFSGSFSMMFLAMSLFSCVGDLTEDCKALSAFSIGVSLLSGLDYSCVSFLLFINASSVSLAK